MKKEEGGRKEGEERRKEERERIQYKFMTNERGKRIKCLHGKLGGTKNDVTFGESIDCKRAHWLNFANIIFC